MEPSESPMAVVARYQRNPPVDLDSIARDLGIKVYKRPLGKAIAGQIMRDRISGGPSGFSIWVNSEEHPNRQRFTLAHEIAHFILHRDLIETGIVDDTMYRSSLSNYYEVQANRLAADILMPVRLVKAWRVSLQAEAVGRRRTAARSAKGDIHGGSWRATFAIIGAPFS